MKFTVVEGLFGLKTEFCLKAYEYYSDHDFEPNENTIPLLREVVEEALKNGALKV